MKKLLVLGGSEKTRPLVRYAKDQGHYVVLCDRDPESSCRELVDAFVQVNTVEHERVVQSISHHELDGAVSFGSDVNAVSVAHIAKALGLPGNPPESVLIINSLTIVWTSSSDRSIIGSCHRHLLKATHAA